jgi:hypothetical protein
VATPNEIKDTLAEWEPEALLADGLEKALVEIVIHRQRNLALYDFNKRVDILCKRGGMTYDEAVEFLEFNTLGADMGDYTPVFQVFP